MIYSCTIGNSIHLPEASNSCAIHPSDRRCDKFNNKSDSGRLQNKSVFSALNAIGVLPDRDNATATEGNLGFVLLILQPLPQENAAENSTTTASGVFLSALNQPMVRYRL